MAPFIRIALRYLAGALIAKGYFDQSDVGLFLDPELIGVVVMAANEVWYWAARRLNWAK
jgi:hypothetical protein